MNRRRVALWQKGHPLVTVSIFLFNLCVVILFISIYIGKSEQAYIALYSKRYEQDSSNKYLFMFMRMAHIYT